MADVWDVVNAKDIEGRIDALWSMWDRDAQTMGHPLSMTPPGIAYRAAKAAPAAISDAWEAFKTPGDILAGKKRATVADAATMALDVGLGGFGASAPKGALRSGMSWDEAEGIARTWGKQRKITPRDFNDAVWAIREHGDTPVAMDAMRAAQEVAAKQRAADAASMRAYRENRPKTPTPRKRAEILSEPEGRTPGAAFGADDMQDYRKEARAGEEVVDGYVRLDELPKENMVGGKSAYDWSELENGGAIPPITVRLNKNGTTSIIDGNHRVHWFREQGFDSIPAYVIREKAKASAAPPIPAYDRREDETRGRAIGRILLGN